MALGQRSATRIIDAQDLRTGNLGEVLVEAGNDRVLSAVEVEMIDLDVGQDGSEERKLEMRAVALVGLDDQPFAARSIVPLCPCR